MYDRKTHSKKVYETMCMTQNMGAIFFEKQGVWHNMYDTKKATRVLRPCLLQKQQTLTDKAQNISCIMWRVHKRGHIRFRHQSNFFVNFSFLKIKLGAIYSLTLWFDNFPTNGFLSIFWKVSLTISNSSDLMTPFGYCHKIRNKRIGYICQFCHYYWH